MSVLEFKICVTLFKKKKMHGQRWRDGSVLLQRAGSQYPHPAEHNYLELQFQGI